MQLVSLITIHYKREKHLCNLLRGLARNTEKPDEVIIVSIGNKATIETSYPFEIRNVVVPWSDTDTLPIAEARNIGAEKAKGKKLIFLDVDCIPEPDFINKIKKYEENYGGLVMGNPYYLTRKLSETFSDHDLEKFSIAHPSRPQPKSINQELNYMLFWSLCFAIEKKQFNIIGGFDTAFTGYGGEDTDFALRAKELNCPFYLCDAIVYHQQHHIYMPPLNQFENIVNNANLFFRKWDLWPMENHLSEFTELELIDWSEDSTKPIEILHHPNNDMVTNSLVENKPFR